MRNLGWLGALVVVAVGSAFTTSEAEAQYAACPTPVVTYSPVVYNTYQVEDRWYPGKFIGRLGQRLFGTAPAPAYPNYTAAYPVAQSVSYAPTYAAAYAPTYAAAYAPTNAASYAPASTTCCTQTTYRPVIMQPVVEQATYYAPACSACGTTTATSYGVAPTSSCPTCTPTTTYVDQAIHQAPAGSGSTTGGYLASPPPTFRDTEVRSEPTPASGTSASETTNNWNPPQLFSPSDKQVKRPSTSVWTAVYEQPASRANHTPSQSVSTSQGDVAPVKKQPAVAWVAAE